MRVTILGWAYDADLVNEASLLERYATLTGWSEALRSAGIENVTVVHRFRRESVVSRHGVTYCFSADGKGLLWLGRLTAAVVASAPDLVHVNGLEFFPYTWWLRRRLPESVALVVQDHAGGQPLTDRRFGLASLKLAVKRRMMRAADAYLFTALEQASPWRAADLIGDRQPTIAIPEGSTNLEPVERVRAREDSGISGDPAVLWVGRLNHNKDPLCVIDGCARAWRERPALTLTMIYSADDLLDAVRHRVADYPDFAPSVRLVGRVPFAALANYYSAADVFVLGSHHEGSGYAVVEACACGLPPAVTDIASFRVLTGQGHVGRLWPTGNAEACASAILALARSTTPKVRDEVRAHFERALTWPAIGRQARSAYDALLRNRAGARQAR